MADFFKGLKASNDNGDIIGTQGSICCTNKGELSVYFIEWMMFTKSTLLLPDKYHNLTDVLKCYQQRHLELIIYPSAYNTFFKCARITPTLHGQSDELVALEIETPVLHTQSGWAGAKSFETYCNTTCMDLTLHVATELHLKH
eukprot:1784662-Ditylum_brightwellii.AAC.2